MNIGFLGCKYYDRFRPTRDQDFNLDYRPHIIEIEYGKTKSQSELDWYFKYRYPGDKLVLLTEKRKAFEFRFPFILEGLVNFLSKGLYLNYEDVIDLHTNNFHQWNEFVCHGVKTFWLIEEFFKNDKFLNPLGGVFHPKRDRWTVHPGLSRLYVLDALRIPTVDILGHIPAATSRKFENFTEFKNSNELLNYFEKLNKEVTTALTLEINTIIPHIHLNANNTQNSTNLHFKKLKDFFKTHKLEANFDLCKYGYFEKDKSKKTVYLEVDSQSILDETLVIFQAPLQKTIVNTNSKVTYDYDPDSFTI